MIAPGIVRGQPNSRVAVYNPAGFTFVNGGTFDAIDVFQSIPILIPPSGGVQVIEWSTGGTAAGPDSGFIRWGLSDADLSGRKGLAAGAFLSAAGISASAAVYGRLSDWRTVLSAGPGGTITAIVAGAHTFTNAIDVGAQAPEAHYRARLRATSPSFFNIAYGWASSSAGANNVRVHPISSYLVAS